MQYTNAAYKQAVQKLPQNYRMEIEVIFDAETEDLLYPLLCENGENLETEKGEALEYAEPAERIVIPPDDIFEAGFSEAVFLSTFCVGSSVAADFWVRIFNKDGKYKNDALAKAEIRPRVTLFDETGAVTDTVPVGVFFVNQITVQNSDLRLECIDKMRYLEKPYTVKERDFRLYQIMQDIAWSVRANFVTTSAEIGTLGRFVNDTIFDGYTRRQVVELIAESCGSFAVFNEAGNLELRWFQSVPVELRGDWAKNALELNGNTFSLDGNVVQVTGVRIVNEDTELAAVGTDEYLLTINENPITATGSEVFAERILERLSSTKYIPCKWQRIGGDPSLQVGDIVTVIDNKETYNEANYDRYDKYPLYMTSRSWTYNCGGFTDTYCAAGNAERDLNTDRGMTQSKRISRLAKRITEADNALSELTDRETALLLFNEQMFNSMGLYKTVKDSENGGVIVYYHDKTELENSGTIYMFGASGFAWTTDGWNDGEPLWNYGFTGAGDAILNTIHAYMISADLIKTGLLQSQNGASWINMDDGTFCFRAVKDAWMDVDTGEMSYQYENKLLLNEKNELLINGKIVNGSGADIIWYIENTSSTTGITHKRLEIGDISDLDSVYISASSDVWLFAKEVRANATTLATTSDERLKSNVKAISSDARFLSFFDNLTPFLFKYTEGNSGRTHMGLIAQQVEQAAIKSGLDINDIAAYVKSDAHRDDLEGYELALRYDEFVGLIIAKVQAQEKIISDLKKRISVLEEKMSKL